MNDDAPNPDQTRPDADPAVPTEPPAGDPAARPTQSRVRVTGLSDRAASAFVVLAVQTVLVRLVRFGGQLVLAWLLMPEDFGLFALAASLHQFISVLKNAGLRDILIQRESKLHVWANAAFWMSLALGAAGGAIMLIAAPIMGWFFEMPELPLLVQVLALTTVLQSLGQIPTAMLYAQLRFNLAATVEAINSMGLMVLTALFAWMSMGPMSFVLPFLILTILRNAYLWVLLKPRVRLNPQFRRWRYMVGDSARLIGADIAKTAVIQLPTMILGRLYPGSAVVGHYFYGYQLSIQSAWLFARNLDTVLMPSLSKLRLDAERHQKAFLRAVRTISTVGIPLSFLQAAAADPAVRLVLPEKFYPAIPYMVVLSIGMAAQIAVQPASAMLRSQGRFAAFAWISWIQAILILSLVSLAAWLGSPLIAAATIAALISVFGFVHIWVALWGLKHPMRAALGVFIWPTLIGGAAAGLGWYAAEFVAVEGHLGQIVRLAVITAVTLAIYVPLIRIAEPETTTELVNRVKPLIGRFARKIPLGRRKAATAAE